MSAFPVLEQKLDRLYANWAPELSGNARRALAQYLPWISLIASLLSLYAAYVVWHWAHTINQLITYSNNLNVVSGGGPATSNGLTFGIWLSIAILVAMALLYVLAMRPLRERQRHGWDLLFYAMLLNVVYGFIIMLTAYGDFGNFMARLVGSAVGLYALFQIRELYAVRMTKQPRLATKKRALTRQTRSRSKRKKA